MRPASQSMPPTQPCCADVNALPSPGRPHLRGATGARASGGAHPRRPLQAPCARTPLLPHPRRRHELPRRIKSRKPAAHEFTCVKVRACRGGLSSRAPPKAQPPLSSSPSSYKPIGGAARAAQRRMHGIAPPPPTPPPVSRCASPGPATSPRYPRGRCGPDSPPRHSPMHPTLFFAAIASAWRLWGASSRSRGGLGLG